MGNRLNTILCEWGSFTEVWLEWFMAADLKSATVPWTGTVRGSTPLTSALINMPSLAALTTSLRSSTMWIPVHGTSSS